MENSTYRARSAHRTNALAHVRAARACLTSARQNTAGLGQPCDMAVHALLSVAAAVLLDVAVYLTTANDDDGPCKENA